MNEKLGIILLIGAFFTYKFYQHRKAIWHNMNLYGTYFANVMRQKVDEIKKNKRR